nr:multidrug efflux RND transporter permease subunit [uncultured Brevundimonas sp.]
MPQFFIERPVFAWVLAIFIILLGVLAIPNLAIERFPSVAPPTISIRAIYPGASTQAMTDNVVAPIERELSSVKNLLYFESTTDTSGLAQITATFKPGTNPELAQVDVQNRLKAVEPRLPQTVRQTGIQVEAASSGFLMMVALSSTEGHDAQELGDYMSRNLVEDLKRVDGVGRVQSFASERAMRIWVDPQKMANFAVTTADVAAAIQAQNAQIAPGRIGGTPSVDGQTVTVPLRAEGQLDTPEEFAAIVLRSNLDGSELTIGDIARVELGAQSYDFQALLNGKPVAVAAIQIAPGGNAVSTAHAVEKRLGELKGAFPQGMVYSIPYNTAPFVEISIEKVLHTLVEAMVLVFLVMFLFLQNIRYTLIPSIVAPIALLGTVAVFMATGFSINVLTMFGMVLAIGIIVDDAIVVVENVERIMATEGLSPKEATKKAMKEITGAVIGITMVLSAVFIPMAFSSGSVGEIYRQFSVSMAVSILFSALLALSLTPALCATLLKPIPEGHHEKKGFFGWFNRRFDRLTHRYTSGVGKVIGRAGRAMVVFVAMVALLGVVFVRLPSAFLPDEDQGVFLTMFTLPADATAERTLTALRNYQNFVESRKALGGITAIQGFGFNGAGPNTGVAFTNLVDWEKRDGATAQGEIAAANAAMAGLDDGTVMSLNPPAIPELGTSSGFAMRLKDLRNQGEDALQAAQGQLLGLAAQSKVVTGVYPESLPPGSSIKLEIDRKKAAAQGVSFDTIQSTISAAMGSTYVNDFPNKGRLQQVIIQADANARMQVEDVLNLYVRSSSGGMAPLSNFVRPVWETAPLQMVRYDGYPAARISGSAAPGVSSGEAMAEMERLAAQLPDGFAVAWTGASLQEQETGNQQTGLLVLSMLVVFLVLAALYESWTIPLSVILVVPLGLIGAVAATMIRGLPNDVFFKVGMITIIGLSAKNAILIVEFAKMLREQGKGLLEAAVEAARLRLRPIIMTSLAFTLGVVPLVIASGASSATQHAIGTGVFGGMITGTFLAIIFVPVFYVVVVGGTDWLKARIAKLNLRLPKLSRKS